MNDRQVEQALSTLFSSAGDEENVDALADQVWRRNKRSSAWLNCAIFGAAILGCGLSFLVIGGNALLPAVAANLNTYQLPTGSQWIAALGIPVALLASLWVSTLASEQ